MTAQEHPKAPHNQPFNINGSRCKSKKNSWWAVGSSTYFRNKGTKKTKEAFTQGE